ncbi:MAG: peptidylprolyl isomerase [Pleurocapsa sp. SU_5_0]|nr:peptidylprolyl isomerase [Pleurocapsa sp. SU_5_0]NJO95470.1 peptidylprolyl isomerase [Pleurocapsa sp. CRU_1_2]NJR47796.1 peptidylprolyl isomerase [Hyellaceae cyanobacterium CSU_1_1]
MPSTTIDPLATVNHHNIIPLLASYKMMPQLLRERIIDKAVGSIECTPAEIDQAYQNFYQTNQINSETELQIWLQRHNMTVPQLELTVIRPIKIHKFKQQTWSNQLESYFWQRQPDLDLVVYSMIKVKDQDLAQELYFRISAGEQTFTAAASQYSQGIEAYTGGIMNPIGIGRLPKLLAQILRSLNPEELHRPIVSDNHFVIVRLEQIIPAKLNSFTAKSLLNEMFESWLKQQLKTLESKVPATTQLTSVCA